MVVAMIESPAGVAIADEIGAVPGVDVVFVASTDLGSFSGYRQGEPQYESLVTRIHDATLKAGLKLGGPLAWRNRQGFSFFQGPGETSLIRSGAQIALAATPAPGGWQASCLAIRKALRLPRRARQERVWKGLEGMRIRVVLCLMLVLLCYGAFAQDSARPAGERRRFGYGAESDFNSAFVWRGIVWSTRPVMQPSGWISAYGFTLNTWSNLTLSDSPESANLHTSALGLMYPR